MNLDLLRYRLCFLIFITIYFQQVFVINIGGSFKIYELLSVFVIILFFAKKKFSCSDSSSLLLFVFFVISPLVPIILNIISLPSYDYYIRFPEAKDILRFNMFFSLVITYCYCLMCWIVYEEISGNELIGINKILFARIFIYTGSIVSLYSLYGFFLVSLCGFPDIIPSFVDFRNSTPLNQLRPAGFSSEPGTYIFMLGWILFFLICNVGNLSSKFRNVLIFLNGFVICLTMSSQIIGIAISLILGFVIPKRWLSKIAFMAYIFLGICITVYILTIFIDKEMLRYIFYTKLENFLSSPNDTLDSGSFRAYTSGIGVRIVDDFPLGVGSGMSYFHMYKYENMMGIVSWGQRLSWATAPQNAHAKILAELGYFGYLFFIIFMTKIFFASIARFFKSNDPFDKALIFGIPFTLIALLTIYPIYSLFIWVPIAICLNKKMY